MQKLLHDIAAALRAIDDSKVPFKNFRPGVGPYGEPQLIRGVVANLKFMRPESYLNARTKREPDVLIPDQWALEFKIVRPFGDNGKEAEHWSQNLLHPYPGNVSAIGDVFKLMRSQVRERKGVVAIGYEHAPAVIAIDPLIDAFEQVTREVLRLPLGRRCTTQVESLVHPVHQTAKLFGWEVG
jgi:hypothetical protein